jgi:hypothetical protein
LTTCACTETSRPKRLVRDDQRRVQRQGARQPDALTLPPLNSCGYRAR